MKSQRKSGITISYVTLFINSFMGIFLTPFLISSLGIAEYGLYQMVNSFAGYLVILNFGTGVIISRYIVSYREKNDKVGQENFLSHALIITVLLSISTVILAFLTYFGIDPLFENSLSLEELRLAKQLYILMVFNIGLSFFVNAFQGMLNGYEKFAVSNSLMLLRILLRVTVLIILLSLGFKSLAIIFTDLAITIIMIGLEALYALRILKIKIKFHYWDKVILGMIFTFSATILLQSIVNQINQNVDRVVLGALTNTETVAMYSIVLVLFTMFSSITAVIGSVYLPQATKMVTRNATNEELTNLVIRPGRLQFMVAGAALIGFILFGKHFIYIWVGESFLEAYLPTVLLLIPATITLVQSVIISILNAKLKRLVRSIILVVMAIFNITLTIILVGKYGYIGAAVSTSITIILGDIIILNIYYQKVLRLDILRMFKEIFSGTVISLMLTGGISYIITMGLEEYNYVNFIIKVITFLIVYAMLLFKFSFNGFEKNLVLSLLKKILKRNGG